MSPLSPQFWVWYAASLVGIALATLFWYLGSWLFWPLILVAIVALVMTELTW